MIKSAMSSLQATFLSVKQAFQERNIKNASLEARRLISHIAGLEEDVFITHPDTEIAEDIQQKLMTAVKRRISGEPISKIIGSQQFWGLEFKVTQDTLDPRSDTETLIEAVLDYAGKNNLVNKPLKILDLGTGTGCILISLLNELPHAYGVGVDYSFKAAQVALENTAAHNLNHRMGIINADWVTALDIGQFDIIVSNPPYIRDDVILGLSNEVQNHDPILALSGGQNGLNAYKKIIHSLKNEKNLKARIFFEIGFDQENDLVRLVDESNLMVCDSKKDLSGNPRVVEICCGDK